MIIARGAAQIESSQGATMVTLALKLVHRAIEDESGFLLITWMTTCVVPGHYMITSWHYCKKACSWNHYSAGQTWKTVGLQIPLISIWSSISRMSDPWRPHLTTGLKGSAANIMVPDATSQRQGSSEVQASMGLERFSRKKGINTILERMS